MSQFTYYLTVLSMGFTGAGVLFMAANSSMSRSVYTFALQILNYFALLAILFMAYTVTGFDVHGARGAGWLDWSNLVGGITVFYVPMIAGEIVHFFLFSEDAK